MHDSLTRLKNKKSDPLKKFFYCSPNILALPTTSYSQHHRAHEHKRLLRWWNAMGAICGLLDFFYRFSTKFCWHVLNNFLHGVKTIIIAPWCKLKKVTLRGWRIYVYQTIFETHVWQNKWLFLYDDILYLTRLKINKYSNGRVHFIGTSIRLGTIYNKQLETKTLKLDKLDNVKQSQK